MPKRRFRNGEYRLRILRHMDSISESRIFDFDDVIGNTNPCGNWSRGTVFAANHRLALARLDCVAVNCLMDLGKDQKKTVVVGRS